MLYSKHRDTDSVAESTRPLRFGVMCAANGLTEFARKCIQNITKDGLATPVLLIIDESAELPSSLSTKLRKSIRLDGNLWHLQQKLLPTASIPAYQIQPLDECMGGVARMSCKPERKGKWSQYFRAEDIAQMQAHHLDFILKFGFGIIRGAVLQSARYGVWSFHHDDEEKYRGGPPGFWEVYHGDPVTGALLQRLNDRLDGGMVLYKCFVPTNGASHRANLQRIQDCSWHMVRWACLDVLQGRVDAFHAEPSKTKAPIYRAPKDFQVLRFWLRLAGNWVRQKLAYQRIDEWNIGLVNQPPRAFLDPHFKPEIHWSAYKEAGQMVADPFPISETDPARILVEEFNWSTEKGRISELRTNGAETTITPVIDEGLHMSYPYTFRHDGVTYAIPESDEAKSVFLYRLDEATGHWSKEAVLLEGVSALDATVFEHNGRWWLLCSANDTGCGPWSLFVWHAPALRGPWQPHIANPVKTNVTSSRPAGNPFQYNGSLYRPSQDNRKTYGGALCLNRIDELSVEFFRESPVRSVAPDPNGPYPDGMHTLSGNEQFSVIDGKRHTWPLGLLLRRQFSKRLGLKPPGFTYAKVKPVNPAGQRTPTS